MFVQSKRLSHKKNNEENTKKNHNPVDVIVDVLLGFLAKPSAFLHNMAEQAFKVFCDSITKSSLDLILDVCIKLSSVN
jgi:DNA polymerase phi